MVNIEKVFKESLKRISEAKVEGHSFLETFYELFINSSSEIAAMFKQTDMDKQAKMLKRSISEFILCYTEKKVNKHLMKIGKLHSKHSLNIDPKFYSLWLSKILEAVKIHDPKFSAKVEVAWRIILSPGITYMTFAYNKPDLS